MDSFIQTHEAALRLGAFFGIFTAMALREWRAPRRALGHDHRYRRPPQPARGGRPAGHAGNELAERTLVANQVLVF